MTRRTLLRSAVVGAGVLALPTRAAAHIKAPTTLVGWNTLAAQYYRETGKWPIFGAAPETFFDYHALLIAERRFVNCIQTALGRGIDCNWYNIYPQRDLAPGELRVLGSLGLER